MSEEQVDVLLYGLGAIGSFYAFILSRSPRVRLSVVARSNYDAVKKNGLTINSQNHGTHTLHPHKVLRTPSEANQTYDYIVCAHKAINQSSVPDSLAPAVKETDTTIVLMQNGVGNEDPFQQRFPNNVILSGVVWVGATQHTPGIVEHTTSEYTEIGIFFPPPASLSTASSTTPTPTPTPTPHQKTSLDLFTTILREGNTPFSIHPQIQTQRWSKLTWNAAWNSLTTLTGLDTQTWLHGSTDLAIPLTCRLMGEVIAVGRACGVPLQDDLVDELLRRINKLPGIYSSMYVDAKEGRLMEVDVILGVPVQKAREKGIQVPTLELIYALVMGVQRRIESDIKKRKKQDGEKAEEKL